MNEELSQPMTQHPPCRRSEALGRAGRRGLRLAYGTVLLLATLTLSTCGFGSSRHRTVGAAPAAASFGSAADDSGAGQPNAVLVTVAGHAITRAMFAHVFSGLVKSEGPGAVAPAPPDYVACIKHLELTFGFSPQHGSTPGKAALKSDCRAEYQKFERQALASLIVQRWVIGGAAEEGVRVSRGEVALALRKGESGESPAQIDQELANTGRTHADLMLETRVRLLGEGIRHVFAEATRNVSRAQIATYYDEHKRAFALPKRRDLEIVRAASDVEAEKIKREIASGKSFASVLKALPANLQPIYSKNAVVLSYEPRLYREPRLDHAIFAVKPHVLSGPVGISLGFYVFRVQRAYPPHQETLAQSEAAIRQQLPNMLYKRALVAFIKGWRHRWRAKTDCQPGYIIQMCKQFKPSRLTPAESEDPYTLN